MGDHAGLDNRAEQLLRQQRSIAQLGLEATRSTSLPALLQCATELVAQAQPVELCKVLQLMPERTQLEMVAGVGWAPGLVGIARVETDSRSQAGYTLISREPVLVDDLSLERRFVAPSLLQQHGVRSGMSVTISVAGSPWGVLGLHARSVRRFTQDDAYFMQSVAQLLGATIARLAAQQALFDSERHLREAQRIANVGSWEHEPVRDRLTWSAQAFQIFGVHPPAFSRDLAGLLRLVHEPDRHRVSDAHRDALTGAAPLDIEYRIRRPDGQQRVVHEQGELVRGAGGQAIRLAGTVFDVTELRAAQGRAEHMTALLTEAGEVASLGIWEHDPGTHRFVCSDQTCSLFGIRADQFDGCIESLLSLVLPEDRAQFAAALQAATDERVDVEYRIRRPDGDVRWLYQRGRRVRGNSDHARYIGVVMDVTERLRRERLDAWEAQVLDTVFDAEALPAVLDTVVRGMDDILPGSHASIMLVDEAGQQLRLGAAPGLPAAYNAAIDGLRIAAVAGSCGTAVFRKQRVVVDDIANDPLWAQSGALALEHGLRACWSTPVIDSQGQVLATLALYHEHVASPDPQDLELMDRAVRVIGAAFTRLRHAQALRASEEQFRRIFDDAAAGIAVSSLDYRFLDANTAYCALVGYSLEELRKLEATALTLPDDVPEMHRLTQELLQGVRSSYIVERRNRTRSGSIVWLRRSVSVKRDQHGRPVGLIAVAQDISQQKAAEEALARSQSLLRVASRVSRLGAWEIALPERTVTWSDEMCRIHGRPPGYAPTMDNALSFYRADQVGAIRAALDACALQGDGFEMEVQVVPPEGEPLWVKAIGEADRAADGRIVRLRGAVQDINQRKLAEQHVSESEERFRLLAQATQDVIWDWNLHSNQVWWSDSMSSMFGYPSGVDLPDEGRNWGARSVSTTWLARVHPQDRAVARSSLAQVMAGATDHWQQGYRYQRADGTYVAVVDRGFIVRNAEGQPSRMIGGLRDVTEQRALEEQLRQSQRLEAVGQLTGGMAHDFNNLLTVIMGNAEVLADELPAEQGMREMARMIGDAAQRGAELTRSMLAFARRQPLEPQVVDINQLIAGMDGLMRRTLGEQIEIEFVRGAGLWQALVDPAQLESALLNLCLNARDAMMPAGGRLTMETGNTHFDQHYADRHVELSPGQYVMVAVSDTGAGISPENLGRVVEPFFTTKEKGKGTGLGLSMVYGFVKQSRGHVSIYSELGHGTTVKMYLPRVQAQAALKQAQAQTPLYGGTGTILLVEDDALVRRYAASQLVSLGYEVIEASDGPSALRILEQDVEHAIDLLFTDVVMPGGMNGRVLADKAHALRPALPVLYTSGYTENAIVHHGRLDAGVQLLSKPYRRAELARRVHEALANNNGPVNRSP